MERTIGNAFQIGVPDLFIAHPEVGAALDRRASNRERTTASPRPKSRNGRCGTAFGIGIWILTAATQEEYDKLFGPPNWRAFWKESWGEVPDIDALLDELDREGW